MLLKLCLVGSMLVEPLGVKEFALSFVTSLLAERQAESVLRTAGKEAEARPILATPVARAAAEIAPAPAPAPAPALVQNRLSREALQRRHDELARKEQDLQTLERDLDDRLVRLHELEVRIKAMLKEAEEVKDAKYRHLVDVLSNMKAKQAASVLETLDEKIAVKVLSGMRGRQAGEILTFVNPGKAARLSEALARVQLPFE